MFNLLYYLYFYLNYSVKYIVTILLYNDHLRFKKVNKLMNFVIVEDLSTLSITFFKNKNISIINLNFYKLYNILHNHKKIFILVKID